MGNSVSEFFKTVAQGLYLLVKAIVSVIWEREDFAKVVSVMGDHPFFLSLAIAFIVFVIKKMATPHKTRENSRIGLEMAIGSNIALVFFWITIASIFNCADLSGSTGTPTGILNESVADLQLYVTPLIIFFQVIILFVLTSYSTESGWRLHVSETGYSHQPVLVRGVLLPNFVGAFILVLTIHWITNFFTSC